MDIEGLNCVRAVGIAVERYKRPHLHGLIVFLGNVCLKVFCVEVLELCILAVLFLCVELRTDSFEETGLRG